MPPINFIASVSDDYLKNTKGIADILKKNGFTVKNIYEELGTISGSVESVKKIAEIKIKGLDAIEVEKKVKRYKSSGK